MHPNQNSEEIGFANKFETFHFFLNGSQVESITQNFGHSCTRWVPPRGVPEISHWRADFFLLNVYVARSLENLTIRIGAAGAKILIK